MFIKINPDLWNSLFEYPIFQTVSGKLTWSHYLELVYYTTDKDTLVREVKALIEKEEKNDKAY